MVKTKINLKNKIGLQPDVPFPTSQEVGFVEWPPLKTDWLLKETFDWNLEMFVV